MDAFTSLLENLFGFIRHFLPSQDIAFNTLKIESIGTIGLIISSKPLSAKNDSPRREHLTLVSISPEPRPACSSDLGDLLLW
jgi:hypothetical protein